MIYLDNCATTKVRKEVLEAMIDSYENSFANPSSLHNFGMRAEEKLEDARSTIANFLNVTSEEIYFTSGGTESNNTFINGVLDRNKTPGKKIITSTLEHSAVGEVFKKYKSLGYDCHFLSCDENGEINYEELESLMDENVALVSIMQVNNEIGSINDIKRVVDIVKSRNKNTLVHADGVQAFGKTPVNLKELGVDGYSISGHKVHGPKGTGALYVKKGVNINPFILGGNQENGLRSGTENTNGFIGFAKAVEILADNFETENQHKGLLKKKVIDYVTKMEDVVINSPENSPNSILNLSFLNTRGEVILHYLEQDEIYISTTSACHSNRKSKTNLEKIGKLQNICDGSIRICFSYENSEEDIDLFLEKLSIAVRDIRKITMRKR